MVIGMMGVFFVAACSEFQNLDDETTRCTHCNEPTSVTKRICNKKHSSSGPIKCFFKVANLPNASDSETRSCISGCGMTCEIFRTMKLRDESNSIRLRTCQEVPGIKGMS